MTNWWASYAVISLRNEVDLRWPDRNKDSDGIIGDAAHAARVSDHNPRPDGEVCAIDITSESIDYNWLAEHLRQRSLNGDARIKYVINQRKIFDKLVSPDWRAYDGTDPHISHVHVSVIPHAAANPSWDIRPVIPPKGKETMLVLTKSDGSNPRLVDQNSFAIHGIMGPGDINALKSAPAGVVTYWPVADSVYNGLVTQHASA
jgi:hypothetical protein